MEALDDRVVGQVARISEEIEPRVVGYRRDFHRYAESGWTEFRTASRIARRLTDLGYAVGVGPKVVSAQARMGVPSEERLDALWLRAKEEGGDPTFLEAMRGGFTGVVGELRNGSGPAVALRFDIDALDLPESADEQHRPVQEGFVSIRDDVSHACGHDGHAAVGLGVAEVLSRMRKAIRGSVRLIFQPAEEGVRGARSMVEAGVVDGVDYLIGHHLYSGWKTGEVAGGVGGYLATTKFDAVLCGLSAHASGDPQSGKNALLAAASAVLNLYAISRHSDGATRINVGRLVAGSGRNVIASSAHLVVETRGASCELNEYMYARAVRVLETAAAMYGCSLEISEMGSAQGAESDPALASRAEKVAQQVGGFTVRSPDRGGGSEDFSYMVRRVQENGGLATNIGIGADLGGWGHHTPRFDIDEKALVGAVKLLCALVFDLGHS